MKKKVIATLLTAAMVMTMTACGGSSSTSTKDAASSASAASAASSEAASSSSEKADSAVASTSVKASSGETSSSATGSHKIDVILKTLSSEYWQYVKAGCDAYAKDHPDISVDVKGPSSETAYDEMTNMVQTDLANTDYDAIVIAPLQSDSVANQIADAKVPVLAVDTKINSDKIASFIGTGNEAAAKSGGQAAVEAAKALGWEEINCIEIAGVQGDETNTARMKGYKEGVEAAGGTFLDDETQYADATADKAVTAMEGIMSKYPDGVAIICANNDDMAMAAAKTAAGNEAYKNTVFLGFDGGAAVCESIAGGDATFANYISVAQNAYDMGYKAVETAVKVVNGESVEDFVDSGSEIVTKENAQDRLDKLNSYIGK
ncbi:MAG: sugar ABC transporter substrate-binding protein [Lachnospiraceae bacterium]|nr:sugar ABC transporter substrate-binding protein [Lachnospiraceae bacterium]